MPHVTHEQIVKILIDFSDVDQDMIRPDSLLVDLGIDSMLFAELESVLANRFEIRGRASFKPTAQTTVADLLDLINGSTHSGMLLQTHSALQ
ncbi:acyl carrier protein familyprotein [Actinobacteria bacterium OV450]|nr:acyl carrier protein familyprotein [Actinobacteria bacterium OV450]